MLQNGVDSLEQMKRVGFEIETNAGDIKTGLANQSDQMLGMKKKVHTIQGMLTVSNRVLDNIKRTALKNRIILSLVVVFLFLSICFLIYVKWF